MAKIDKVKEQIGWLKVIFGLLFATDISLIAYLFNKIEKLDLIHIYLVLFALFIVTTALFYVNRKAMKKIDELEDIE
jgi:Mn2+/Fe2+ NRAMP family transporter